MCTEQDDMLALCERCAEDSRGTGRREADTGLCMERFRLQGGRVERDRISSKNGHDSGGRAICDELRGAGLPGI